MGAFLGGLAGVKINEKVKSESVQLGFSILVIIIALSLIWSQL